MSDTIETLQDTQKKLLKIIAQQAADVINLTEQLNKQKIKKHTTSMIAESNDDEFLLDDDNMIDFETIGNEKFSQFADY